MSLLLSASYLASCGDSTPSNTDITDSQLNEGDSALGEYGDKVKDIFHAMPSPMEMASMLKKLGAQYDAKILNEVKNVNVYTTSRSQALNLGIYGADLSYASVFNQNQESIIYLSCVKKLADNLGVTQAFNDDTIERIEANIDNRDSLLTIVAETFYELDSYLKENGREHISAMVIAAGWIEGLYISTSIGGANQSPSEELMQRIGEQKLSLVNLKTLVDAYNSEGQLDEIANDIQAIEKAFEGVTVVQGATGVATDQDGNTVIGSPTTVTISNDAFQNIKKIVSEIRLRYIS